MHKKVLKQKECAPQANSSRSLHHTLLCLSGIEAAKGEDDDSWEKEQLWTRPKRTAGQHWWQFDARGSFRILTQGLSVSPASAEIDWKPNTRV